MKPQHSSPYPRIEHKSTWYSLQARNEYQTKKQMQPSNQPQSSQNIPDHK
jgi:hypothetical protein